MVLYDEKEIARVLARIPSRSPTGMGSKASSRHRPKTCERFAADSLSAAQRNRCPLMQDDTADDAVVQVRRDLLARRRPPLDLLEQALRHRLAQSGFLIPEHHVDGV